ncbi:SCO2525 family SAM-dependent methyltransferase [Streptomyces sp. NPDC090106]|uniref:SCO2525 family SAM-dependent methyltransferase n=1 Tax=Streptomyces sp. NPDC090106 TaxID=3365946 RepID=UPI00381773D3
MHFPAPVDECVLNDQAPWNNFDNKAYVAQNYLELLPVDEEILVKVGRYFSRHCESGSEGEGRPVLGIDMGAGGNLYPALAMLPWCRKITLFERAPENVAYLRQQRDDVGQNWEAFWKVLCETKAYSRHDSKWKIDFQEAARVEQGNLFKMGQRNWLGLRRSAGKYQIGTMFFVAESISTSPDEFRQAIDCFMNVLAPGAPFAAAFMEGSHGYDVGTEHFPACDVDKDEVEAALTPYASDLEMVRLSEAGHLVRPGHTGMILACGKRSSGG